jgi:hypothetical protein
VPDWIGPVVIAVIYFTWGVMVGRSRQREDDAHEQRQRELELFDERWDD